MDLNAALLYCIHLLMHRTGVPNNDHFIPYIQPKPAKKRAGILVNLLSPHACNHSLPSTGCISNFCRSLINCHLFGLYIDIHILPLYPVVYTVYSCWALLHPIWATWAPGCAAPLSCVTVTAIYFPPVSWPDWDSILLWEKGRAWCGGLCLLHWLELLWCDVVQN